MSEVEGAGPGRSIPPSAGRVLAGRYQLVSFIAQGGMAEVWEGRDLLLARPVAIKVPLGHLARDERAMRRFRREAVAAARLTHPNVVAVYDTGTDQGDSFIVMERMQGTSIKDLLTQGPMAADRAVGIAAQVAGALDFAHRAGVVHRDIKPANILVADDGTAKVTDFGIAKAAQDEDLTQTNTTIGTARYLAPEQVDGHPPDGRTDVYALGVVLYEMLCGRAPFVADNDLAMAMQHLHQPPPPPTSLESSIPAWLETVVLRALAKVPEHRFAAAADLRLALLRGADLSRPTILSGPGMDRHEALPRLVTAGATPPQGVGTSLGSAATGGVAATGLVAGEGLARGTVAGESVGREAIGREAIVGGVVAGGSVAGASVVKGPVASHIAPDLLPPPAGSIPTEGGRAGSGPSASSAGSESAVAARTTAFERPGQATTVPAATAGGGAEVGGTRAVPGASTVGRSRAGASAAGASRSGEPRQRRRLVPLTVAVLAAVAVAVAATLVVRVRHGSGGTALRGRPPVTTVAGPSVVPVAGAVSFDPQGDGKEDPTDVPKLFDGNPSTYWQTDHYNTQAFGNLKHGVGFVLHLGQPRQLQRITLLTDTRGWSVSIYLSPQFHSDLPGWGSPVVSGTDSASSLSLSLAGHTGAQVLVWFTHLGPDDTIKIGEVKLLGR